jgi:hypothetical protein
LPVPPTVALPQQITGTGAHQPGCATRRAVKAAVTAASGDSSRAATPRLCQNRGGWNITIGIGTMGRASS